MTILDDILIAFCGVIIGIIAASIIYHIHYRRLSRDIWKASNLYYTRKQDPDRRRI